MRDAGVCLTKPTSHYDARRPRPVLTTICHLPLARADRLLSMGNRQAKAVVVLADRTQMMNLLTGMSWVVRMQVWRWTDAG